MAENKESIIIDVQVDTEKVEQSLGSAIHSMAALKEEQKRLTKEIAAGNDVNNTYAHELVNVNKKIEENKRAIKSNTAILQAARIEQIDNTKSLDDQRQALNDLQKAYAGLSGDEKKAADKAGGLRDQIKTLSDSVKAQEAAIGDNRRNVGNYAEALKDAGINGVDAFDKKMKALWSNPWAAIIGVIVLAIKKLVDAFKSSEDRMREITSAFAPLRAAGDFVQQVFDKFAKTLSVVVVGALDGVAKGIRGVAKLLDKLGAALGKDWGISEAFEKAEENTKKLAAAEQAYIDHKRNFAKQEAALLRDVAQLREKVADKENYTNEERIKFLELANQKEIQIAAEKKKLAQENLAILRMQAAESENDAAMNDRLAEAEADVIRVDTELAERKRKLTSQLSAAYSEQNAEAEKLAAADKKRAEDAAKEAERQAMELEKAEREKAATRVQIERELQDQLLELIPDKTDRELAAEELENTRKIEALKTRLANLGEEEIAARANVEAMIENQEQIHQNNMTKILENADAEREAETAKALEERRKNAEEVASSVGGALGAISGMLDQFGEDNKAAAIASKVLALGQIAIETGKAIAAGVAGAMAVPFPANIPAIATTIAAIASNIGTAVSTVKNAKFENGGVVGGNSYTGDRVLVRANSGEGIFNGKQANSLLYEIANNPARGGLDYDLLGSIIAAANMSLPAPVMVYEEFNDFTGKVTQYKDIAKV